MSIESISNGRPPGAIGRWLESLLPVLDPARLVDWPRLSELAAALNETLVTHPLDAGLTGGVERSRRLHDIRRALAVRGHLNTGGHPPLFGVLTQFVCGYRDIDLRDATGLGHGQLIARHGSARARQHWIPRLLAGELAGIAVTEAHGGSRPAETRTAAVHGSDGTWLITGGKTWISRLNEAAVFVVFFLDPHGHLAAAAIDATTPGLHRQPLSPTGLAGWSWGVLELDAVPVRDTDVLHGDGMELLREHFAAYRPLVTATALGGAAAVFDTVAATLVARRDNGELTRLRDTALVTLGRTHAQLMTALLGVVVAAQLSHTEHQDAERWGAAMKAHGIDTANQAAAELALLLGAVGYRTDSPVAKIRRDLGGLLYADGIHDSLYRAAGKQHTIADQTLQVAGRWLDDMPTTGDG
ncbi:acyl-CoA dehydrogenase family protein [Actinoalloteichus hymeniacidonis]|uniref:Acyl-CoA dehydrogenase n=1 Tax=Actinoalloteichus hymeniacidonis TaxID=340345 RepID=A0AAC9MWN1_9PSEU|nr:acyl-CoA dehydrogenase family protein [Actinoalloteichus hymeniacidonis]AOS61201.1 acyl-CoA dehydrogenase [Actinoalloteichus hymeniacidonis]MBB5910797.1 alkylation response protein AidB-like acyl-CoA dehydrogenase [Actinoalloteichus hymeniacidonis]